MRKNNFINGAMVATLGIVVSKIIGILYVIPFYNIIGEQGGALYGYAYTMYSIFLTISVVGIPLAMSRLVSEYLTKKNYYTKERIFKLGLIVVNILGLISFVVLMLIAPLIADSIVGGTTGGNSVEDVTFVLRVVALGILIIPTLSVSRGYLQGHQFIAITSISQVLEQIVRVAFILLGSYMAAYVFKLDLVYTVAIAIFASCLGAIASYLYIFIKMKKNKDDLNKNHLMTREERTNTDKFIIKKILMYALPFIIIDVIKDSYHLVDALVVVKTMVGTLGYSIVDAETVMAVITTWGNKLIAIVVALASGLIISLIPSITKSIVAKDKVKLNNKINQTYDILLYISVPIVIAMSIYSNVVWNLIYGNDLLSIRVFSFYILSSVVLILFTVSITILQCFNSYKMVFVSLLSGLICNVTLNVPFMLACDRIEIDSFYGNISATMFGYFVSTVLCLVYLIKRHKVNLLPTFNNGILIIGSSVVYTCILVTLNYIFEVSIDNKFLSVIHAGIYVSIALCVYIALTYKKLLLPNLDVILRRKKKKNVA